MSKALLIINMPNHCGECACHVFGHECYRYCCLSGHRLDDKDYCIERLDNCPLKPMPEKKIHKPTIYAAVGLLGCFELERQKGFNDCVNEILGEEE